MNKITLIGNLTHDPEVRSTPNGVTVCSFTIAVNRRFASGAGGAKDGTTRMSLDVQADEVEFLSPKQQEDGSAPVRGGDNAQDMAGFTDIQSDDIPF